MHLKITDRTCFWFCNNIMTQNFDLVAVLQCHNGTVNRGILGVSVHLSCLVVNFNAHRI